MSANQIFKQFGDALSSALKPLYGVVDYMVFAGLSFRTGVPTNILAEFYRLWQRDRAFKDRPEHFIEWMADFEPVGLTLQQRIASARNTIRYNWHVIFWTSLLWAFSLLVALYFI